MKINKNTILISLTILFIVFFALIPIQAQANILDGPAMSVLNNILAIIFNAFLGLTSILVTVSGTFLNISINLSMHIGDFFNSIPALNDTWVVVRNISSMLIIFLLLYSSIMTIVGSGTANIKKLVINIVIAGLLINFSLFFTKLLIDASNIVSLQFYRAIAPEYASQGLSKLSTAFYDGGLSNIFLQSLKIPKIYANNSILKTTDISFSIILATFGGIIMMITAAFSLFAAAIAITIRTGILLFIMAMSPLYFVAKIFPQAQDKSGKLMGMFKGQLIFMPAYLFLTYISLKLISSPGFSSIFNQSATAVTNEGTFGPTFIGVIIQFVIALMFIDLPLIMALSLGAMGAKWVPDSKSISKMVGNAMGRNTLGYAASRVAESERFKKIAAYSPMAGLTLSKAVTSVSGASFGGKKGGYDAKVKADTKAIEGLSKALGKVNRVNYKTKDEFKKAEERTKEYKSKYTENLAGRSIMNLMLKNRTNQMASFKLQEEKDRADAKKNKKKNEAEMKENLEKINEIDKKLNNPTEGTGFGAETLSQEEQNKLKEEKDTLKKRNDDLNEKISLASKAEGDDILEKLKKSVNEDDSKEEKPEKKEGGGKDKK